MTRDLDRDPKTVADLAYLGDLVGRRPRIRPPRPARPPGADFEERFAAAQARATANVALERRMLWRTGYSAGSTPT